MTKPLHIFGSDYDLYQIRMISYCKSLRLEQSGRKQSHGFREIASYRRNDNLSTGFYIRIKYYFAGKQADLILAVQKTQLINTF